MKKRVLILILIFLSILFVIQNTKAEVVVTSIRSNTFNLGDQVSLKGYVRAPSTDTWTLTHNLQCDGRITQINKRVLSLTFDQRIDFDENIRLNDFGSCNFIVKFVSNSGTTEEATSSNFLVTKELRGDFNLDKTKVHFGDQIKLTGTIKRLDGTLVNGFGSVAIKKDNENYLVSSINILDGSFNYETSIDSLPQGNYNFEVTARDIYGNEQVFRNIAQFEVTNKLTLNFKLSNVDVNPSSRIDINGNVLNANGKPLKSGEAIIKVDFDEFRAVVIDGSLDFFYSVPKNINSGEHTMTISVKDEYDNAGETTLKFKVNPITSKLDVETDKELYRPKDLITITPFLYDQAEDPISKEVTIVIKNSKNEEVITKTVESNSEAKFKLTDYANPGKWKITASSSGLSDELDFEVGEVNDISTTLEDQKIIVKNIGNIKYVEDIEVIAEGEDKIYTINKRTNLNPEESFKIYLYKEIPPGTYTILISNTKFKQELVVVKDERSAGDKIGDYFNHVTGSVVQTKGSTSSYKPLLSIFLVLLFILLLMFSFRFSARRKINRRREYQRNLGKETFSKIMKEKETQMQKTEVKDRPQFRRGFGIKQESQEMTDLKRKIESDLKKSPVSHDNNIEVRSNVNYTNNTEKKNEKKGLFRMFD
ncbi:hypothetical protein J4455_03515 [Candidatus Woesearchaeota archaeon]|nr:hypothetical protein [Candidatus Woesearchaeota archaeon]